MVHHRNVARLRPRVDDRGVRRGDVSPRPRATPDARRPRGRPRRRAAADRARRHRPRRGVRVGPPRPRALRPPRRRRQQRRLRPVRDGRGDQRAGGLRPDRDEPVRRVGVTQAALPFLREQRSGHILQVSSIGGISAFTGIGMYHASKWALEGITQSLAQEVRDFGIHVTLIEPGGFSTDWGGASARHAEPLDAGTEVHEASGERRARGNAGSAGDPTASAQGDDARRRRRAARARLLRQRAVGHRRAGLRGRLANWREWQPLPEIAQGRTQGRSGPGHATAPAAPGRGRPAGGRDLADPGRQLDRRTPPTPLQTPDACAPSTRPRWPRRASCARSPPARPAGSPRRASSTSTATAAWRSSRRSTRPSSSTPTAKLGKGTATKGRVDAPGVVADLDGDKVPEIVVGGNEGTVAAYDLVGGKLQVKPGWPASTCSGGQCPEARGMAAADLDGDGRPRGRGDDDQHLADRVAGLRLRAGRPLPTGRASPTPGRATTRSTPTSTASATTATAPTARTSASATSTTTRSWRSSSRSTTTRSTSSTTTGRRCSRRRGSPTARAGTPARGSAGASSSAG